MTLTFSGWPKAGDKMRFLGRGGHDNEREAALKVLEVGQVLTVESCDVGDWSHSIRFMEIAGNFNGVMFEMDEALPMTQDSHTLTADEAVLYALEVLHTFARDRGQGELRTRHNAEMDTHMRTIRSALNQGQG